MNEHLNDDINLSSLRMIFIMQTYNPIEIKNIYNYISLINVT